jgi:hypothetical protein
VSVHLKCHQGEPSTRENMHENTNMCSSCLYKIQQQVLCIQHTCADENWND